MQTIAVAIRAVTYMAVFVLTFMWLAFKVPGVDGRSDTMIPVSVIPLGAVLMACGGLLTWLGLGLLWGSWFVLALTAVLALIVHLFVVLYEEPTLRRLFGADYDMYCHTVHRWPPSDLSALRPM